MSLPRRSKWSLLFILTAALLLVVSTVVADAPNPYEDGYVGTAGYLPAFHPKGLTPGQVTADRVAAYSKTPDPSNITLEDPADYQATVACLGRGFDPRGPFAEPPQAPYLVPGNISSTAFGDDGTMYVAVTGIGFNNVVFGTPNNDPSKGPLVSAENTAGVYKVSFDSAGKCNAFTEVSGGPDAVGTNVGPHPEFGDFGTSIDGLAFHNGMLYVNSFSGGAQGAISGAKFSAGRLLQVDPATGNRTALIANLPAEGDHQNDAMVFYNEGGRDWIEFEQGTTTNSGTADGEPLGDIPCFDVTLTDAGKQFYPFTTGYKRYDRNIPPSVDPDHQPLQQPQPDGSVVVHGTLPCSGSTMALPLDSQIQADGDNPALRLTGFGFRNPYGMAIAPSSVPVIGGELLISNNDADVRGQRPLANAADDFWPLEVNGRPERNWGWPNQINFFSTADPQFGLADNQLAQSGGAYTGNQALRDPNQPGQSIIGQAPIFTYNVDATGQPLRGGQALPAGERVDLSFVPGIGLSTVDISANGLDFSTNSTFGHTNDFFVAGFGNLEFPIGSTPAGMVGKDIRQYHIVSTADGKFVGTVQTVFAHNTVQTGGQPNVNTGGFLGPLDLKFDPAGDTMYLIDFGGYMTSDSGWVGGYRCDPGGDCSNGAKANPAAAHPGTDYGITLEQFPGTAAIWAFTHK